MNFHQRQMRLKKIDADNMRLLERLANPKKSLNKDEWDSFAVHHEHRRDRLIRSKKPDVLAMQE